MIWLALVIILGCLAFGLALGAIFAFITAADGQKWGVTIGLAALVLTALAAFGAAKSGIALTRHYGSRGCDSFAGQTGYEVSYIVTTWMDGGHCYVEFDGRWVPKDQLWAEMGGRS